jgi:hypothetical protein
MIEQPHVHSRRVEAMCHQPKTFWVAAAGVAAMFVGTLGPWMKVLGHGRPGAGGDGQVLLIAALVAVAFLWHHVHEGGTALGAAGLTLGVVGAVFCGWHLYDLVSAPEAEVPGKNVEVLSAGWGIYASLVGSLMLAGASYVLWRDETY